MDELRFTLSLTAEEFLPYYQGVAKTVRVRAHDGRTIDLPATRLRPFVTRQGIHGEFLLRLDDSHRVVELRMAGAPATAPGRTVR